MCNNLLISFIPSNQTAFKHMKEKISGLLVVFFGLLVLDDEDTGRQVHSK